MSSGRQIRGQALFNRQQAQQDFTGPTIICDGLRTPENFGSILRIADATGCREIILLDSDLDLGNKKLSRLARSCDRHLDITRMSRAEFETCRQRFRHLYALEITSASHDLFETDISACDAIVTGHESGGISDDLLALCDKAIHLPMYGVNGSMNLSHALAVFLYEWRRQRSADH